MNGCGLLAGGQVDGGQRARHRRDRLHRGADPQWLAVGHAAFEAAGPIRRADDPVGAGVHLVVSPTAAPSGGLEPVTDLDALDGLDAHHRSGELAVEPVLAAGERPQSDRQAVRDDLHHSAEGVAVLLRSLDLGDHRLLSLRVERPHRARVDAFEIVGGRRRAVVGRRGTDRDDVRHHLDAESLAQERPRHGAGRDPRRGLAGTGAFQDWAGVLEAVLEHARVVGVAGPRPGQRRVARLAGVQDTGIHRIGGHHGLPLGPLGVADLDGDRSAHRAPVANPGEDRHGVLLELHPGAAAITEPTAGQLSGEISGGQFHAGDHALDQRNQGAAVGFTGGGPSQHAMILPCPRPGTQSDGDPGAG